jgi:tRNA(Ile)-lysidine synthase
MLLQKAQPLRTIVWELIKPFGFSEGQVGEVVKLCKAASGAYVSATDWRIIKHRNWLLVSPIAKVDATLVVWEEAIESIELPIGRMTKEIMACQANVSIDTAPKSEALLDAKKIQFPLVCRPWRPGDYFYPLGMAKKKKVSRILIDLKLSKVEKEGIWVLESANRIVWVIGQRIDDRVKVTSATTQIARLKLRG